MENKTILIVDVRAMAHAAKHGLGKHRLSKDDRPTFVLHGFLTRLLYIGNKVKPDFTVFALDCPKERLFRRKLFADYKNKPAQKKSQADEELDKLAFQQFIELETVILTKLGFNNVFYVEGLEADDIIASVAKTYGDKNYITIATHDNDIFQCLRTTVEIWNLKTNRFYTKRDFIKDYGIKPREWAIVKKYIGCTSDNVPGIPGVKEKTIIKYFFGLLNPTTQAYKKITEVNKDFLKLNKKLVKLPFKGTPKFKLKRDHLNMSDLKEVCKKYGFKVLYKRRDEWKKLFNFS